MEQQARDQSSQLVRRRRDGLGGAESRLHTPEQGAEGTLRVVETASREPQGDGDPVGAGSHAPRQHLAARDLVLGTPPQPTAQGFDARPAPHVGTDLTEEDQGRAFLDALESGQGDARQARE